MDYVKKWLQLRNVSIPYIHFNQQQDPARPLLVLLHGFPDDASAWLPLAEKLKDKFNLLIPYIGRVGNPKLPKSRLKVSRLTMDVIDLVNSLYGNESHFFVIAHDLGGAIARELEFLLSGRVRGVSYINSMGMDVFSHRLKDRAQLKKSYYMILFQMPFFNPSVVQRFHKRLEKRLSKFGWGEQPSLEIQDKKNVWQGIELYRSFLKELPGMFKQKRKSSVPCLFLFSTKDPFINIPPQSALDPYYNNFKIRVLEGGHWIQLKETTILANLLENFIYDSGKRSV